jgi:FixJ family two-component response regulator
MFLLFPPASTVMRLGSGRAASLIGDLITVRSSSRVVAVIDDDARILRSLEDLLESADYHVRAFTSGAALLESGCLSEIGCLISDVDMPGMDGFELLKLVHEARAGLPAILITGYPETLQRLLMPGGSNPRVFTKPFDGRELLSAVAGALGKPPE